PLIAKVVIDDHVLGVEGTWDEVAENDDRYTVAHDGGYYKRSDRLEDGENALDTVTILQAGGSYYFFDEVVPFKGKRNVEDGEMVTIETADETETYQA